MEKKLTYSLNWILRPQQSSLFEEKELHSMIATEKLFDDSGSE